MMNPEQFNRPPLFVPAAPAAPPLTMEGLFRFMTLLNERWPIDRSLSGNFHGNHSVVFDTTGLSVRQPCCVVNIWIWKQLEWRHYPVSLVAPGDLSLSPEDLVNEIDRVLAPEIAKLIAPTARAKPQP